MEGTAATSQLFHILPFLICSNGGGGARGIEVLPSDMCCENSSMAVIKTGIVKRKFSRSYRLHAVLCIVLKWLGRCTGV